jgi:hypothetical protein
MAEGTETPAIGPSMTTRSVGPAFCSALPDTPRGAVGCGDTDTASRAAFRVFSSLVKGGVKKR